MDIVVDVPFVTCRNRELPLDIPSIVGEDG
jgi:hypothetical protein